MLVAADGAIGDGLASGLAVAGGAVEHRPPSYASREDAERSFAATLGRLGRLDAVVHAADHAAPSAQPAELAEVGGERWSAVWETTMRSTLFFLQAAWTQLHERGGAIVLVVPALSMYGAARLAPLATAAEGQRLLAKSAARQWGGAGITVNCVAVPIAAAPGEELSLAPAALGAADGLVAIVASLLGDAGRHVTGQTLTVDGGAWMAP